MRKSILLFFLISFCHRLSAQKTIVLEKIRCYDINQPLNYYLRNPKTAATITSQLNQSLLKYLKMPLSDTSQLPLELIDFKYVPPDIRPDYKNRDTSILHLYIDLFESDPYYYFRRNKDKEFDSATIKKTKTVFILRALLLDASQKLYKAETLDLLIGEAETPAIGNKVNNGIQLVDLAVTEKTFTEFFKTAMDLLLNTTNPLSSVQLNLQPAYMYDNYLLQWLSLLTTYLTRTLLCFSVLSFHLPIDHCHSNPNNTATLLMSMHRYVQHLLQWLSLLMTYLTLTLL